jgi:hypothetical protein
VDVLELEDERVPVGLPLGDRDELTDAVPVGDTVPVREEVVVLEPLALDVGEREDVVVPVLERVCVVVFVAVAVFFRRKRNTV